MRINIEIATLCQVNNFTTYNDGLAISILFSCRDRYSFPFFSLGSSFGSWNTAQISLDARNQLSRWYALQRRFRWFRFTRCSHDAPEVNEMFSTDAKCRELLERLRWPEGVMCPRCKDTRVSRMKDYARFECVGCEIPVHCYERDESFTIPTCRCRCGFFPFS